MLRLTLAQMRRSVGRLVAAGVAVLIGTAFVAATLLAGDVITRTTNDSIAAQFAQADLVVSAESLTDGDVAAVRGTAGVAAADPVDVSYADLSNGGRRVFQGVVPTTSDPRLMPLTVVEGTMPTGTGQVALPTALAERLDVGVGDTVTSTRTVYDPVTGDPSDVSTPLAVVGTLDDPYGAYAQMGGAAVVDAADLRAWDAERAGPDEQPVYSAVTVALDPGTDVEAARGALLAAAPEGAKVVTPDEHAQDMARSMTGDQDVFTRVILGFAAVALLVAALVIANTFQVLVAQRTRTLALLRCVGADKGQLSRSVLLEATLLGLVSSVAGVVVGAGLTQVALLVARGMDLGVPIPSTVALTPAVVLVPVVVGTLVTLVASFSPARAATRVAPLAALRPADSPTVATGAGKVRLVLSLLLVVGGFGVLAAAVALGMRGSAEAGLAVGVLGGAVSFVGVLLSAVFWLPKVVAGAGRLVAGTGSTARLAAANTLRNPRRTAATSTALLIGVTLVAMMSTGAASARASLDAELDSRYPVDVVVAADAYGSLGTVPASTSATVGDVDGVRTVVPLLGATVTTAEGFELLAHGVDPAAAASVARSAATVAALAPGTVLLDERTASDLGFDDGSTLTLTGPDGASRDLTVAVQDGGDGLLLTRDDLLALAPDATTSRLWVGLDDVGDAGQVVPGVQDALAGGDAPVDVLGAAVERASYQQVIDTVLGVVVGLLAVAVVIALIGVANTLSLSVIERRRESATLRAIGLSKGQLRGMLAIEGVLIAGVGAVLGVVLGLVYGWAGAAAALSVMGDVSLAVPWRDVALVLVVALTAGLLASVVPARSAVRTSPVEALAVD